MSNTAIQQAIEESMDDIKARDDALMMEVVGVTQAIDHLRKALDQVEACLDTRVSWSSESLLPCLQGNRADITCVSWHLHSVDAVKPPN